MKLGIEGVAKAKPGGYTRRSAEDTCSPPAERPPVRCRGPKNKHRYAVVKMKFGVDNSPNIGGEARTAAAERPPSRRPGAVGIPGTGDAKHVTPKAPTRGSSSGVRYTTGRCV